MSNLVQGGRLQNLHSARALINAFVEGDEAVSRQTVGPQVTAESTVAQGAFSKWLHPHADEQGLYSTRAGQSGRTAARIGVHWIGSRCNDFTPSCCGICDGLPVRRRDSADEFQLNAVSARRLRIWLGIRCSARPLDG